MVAGLLVTTGAATTSWIGADGQPASTTKDATTISPTMRCNMIDPPWSGKTIACTSLIAGRAPLWRNQRQPYFTTIQKRTKRRQASDWHGLWIQCGFSAKGHFRRRQMNRLLYGAGASEPQPWRRFRTKRRLGRGRDLLLCASR